MNKTLPPCDHDECGLTRCERETKPPFAEARGCDARIEKLRARQNAIRLERIEQLLQDAGVPEWVQTIETGLVPSNAPDYRLQWFLARRKNVKPAEIDQKLQREMAGWMRILSQRHNNELTDRRDEL